MLYVRWVDEWVAGFAKPWVEELPDLKEQHNIAAMVRLQESTTELTEAIAGMGFHDLYVPILDMTAPTIDLVDRILAYIRGHVAAGRKVGVSCMAGQGRTGTVLSCYLLSKGGYTPRQAMKAAGFVEVSEQVALVHQYCERLRSRVFAS